MSLKPNQFFVLLTIQSSLFTACATLVSREQVLSIDSNTRGAKIFSGDPSQKQDPLGTTPDFLRVERETNVPLTLIPPGSQHQVDYTIDCKFRWGTVLLGNLIFYYAWPLAVGIDYWTGNAFDCPLKNYVSLPQSNLTDQKNSKNICKNYFLVFPSGTSHSTMQFIWENWRQQYVKGCDKLVDVSDTIDSLERYNLHSGFSEFGKSERRRFFEVGYEFKVTHLVLIKFSDIEDIDQDAEFNVVDIHSEQVLQKQRLKIDAEKYTGSQKGFSKNAINTGIDLLPNSITFAPLYEAEVAIDHNDKVSIVETKNKISPTRKIFANWSLRNIDHPHGYEDWDYSFRFAPDMSFRYFSQSNKYYLVSNPNKNIDYSFYAYSGVLTGNAEINLHTPFGAFNFALGFGPGYEYFKDSTNTKTKQIFDLYVRMNMAYTVFMTENWFGRFFASATNPIFSPVKTSIGKISSSTISGLEFGYYFPWVRTTVHRWLN